MGNQMHRQQSSLQHRSASIQQWAGVGTANFNFAGGQIFVEYSNLTTSLPMTLSGTASSVNTGGWNATLSGNLTGSGALTKYGAGTLYLTGASNTYSGGTTLIAGVINVSAASELGSGPVTVQSGTLQSTGAYSSNTSTSVSGTGSALTAATFIEFGPTTAGTLTVSSGGSVTATTTAAFGVDYSTSQGVSNVTGSGSSLNVGTVLYLGYSGTGVLSVGSGGSVTVGSTLDLGYYGGSGLFNLNTGGTLYIGGANGIQVGSGTANFNFAGGQIFVEYSNLTTSLPMTLSGTSSSVNTGGWNATLSGNLAGSGALTKYGGGTLYLTGASNTYSGGTTLWTGSLNVTSAAALGTGPISVQGGTLQSTTTYSTNVATSVANAGAGLTAANYIEIGPHRRRQPHHQQRWQRHLHIHHCIRRLQQHR